jgi:hypothetical protein
MISGIEWKNFGFGDDVNTSFIELIRRHIEQLNYYGRDRTVEIVKYLNKNKIGTASRDKWTPRLVTILLFIMSGRTFVRRSGKRGNRILSSIPRSDPRSSNISNESDDPRLLNVVAQLRRKSTVETVKIWRNALETIANPLRRDSHSAALRIVRAIRDEWERRRDSNDWFRWPSTAAESGSGQLIPTGWQREGFLKFLGYAVGETKGKGALLRRQLMNEIFEGPLPPVFNRDYLAEWSAPGSVGRLRKLAETIAALTRNAKRRQTANMRQAIEDWESDLEYLRTTFYVGRFNFDWPRTQV